MKHYIPHICYTVAFSSFLMIGTALAQDRKMDSKDPKAMEEMMKKAEELGKPGAGHKALDSFVGEWNTETKCWMAPDAPPTVNKGTSKASWILGGRFIQEEFSGEMMGKPFKGIGFTGYDNMKQKYNSIWLDDMSTAVFISQGTSEDGGQVFTFDGKMDCPMTGQKDMPIKNVLRIISPDKHIFEMHDPSKGEQSKMMEITYTRK